MRPARVRNIVVTVVAVILILLGLLWVGQGLGLIGGAMNGDTTWFIVGAILVIIGVLLLALGRRRAESRGPDPRL